MTRRNEATPFQMTGAIARRTNELLAENSKVRRCTKCLVPETEQTATFNDDGVCNMCERASERDEQVDWELRERELREVLDQYRGKYRFDAIVPFSGGKDSAWTAYVLIKRYNLKVLLVTFDSHFRRPKHMQNIERIVRHLGCEHITFRASDHVIRKTMVESLKRRGDFCWFCHTGVVASPFKAALMHKVPLLIWGEPGTDYSGGYYSYKTKTPSDERWFNRQINLGINAEDMHGFLEDVELRDLEPFQLPSWQEMKDMGVTSIHLGDYIKWDAPGQHEILHKELGWEGAEVENLHPRYHYEKVECFLQGTRDFLRYIKRGYSRTVQRANLDVRTGVLTREEAEDMIHYDAQRPNSLDVILKYMDMEEDEFMRIAEGHQIFPHRHDPDTVRVPQKKLDDHEIWEKRLTPPVTGKNTE